MAWYFGAVAHRGALTGSSSQPVTVRASSTRFSGLPIAPRKPVRLGSQALHSLELIENGKQTVRQIRFGHVGDVALVKKARQNTPERLGRYPSKCSGPQLLRITDSSPHQGVKLRPTILINEKAKGTKLRERYAESAALRLSLWYGSEYLSK